MLTECACGEPLYEYQQVCTACGASNRTYVQFGWGRRMIIAVVAIVPSFVVENYNYVAALIVGGLMALAFVGIDHTRRALSSKR